MKLLSITVPCYNSQEYIRTCVDSLLAGGDKVEILIINDGSSDDTGIIADEYAEKYPETVKVIHQENGGHGEGINQGLRHATGTYFKVVDSDDKLGKDFPAFLEQLEALEAQGGVDLVVSNYYYVHSDGIGDRSINYSNALPQNRIFTWTDTKPFWMNQLLTIHSCTFRREVMLKWTDWLPRHTFYEDNLMVYQTLPHIQKMYYVNSDLYRYTIGREGQSVQEDVMKSRYHHQILVTEKCFTSCRLDSVRDKKRKRYMKHELFMMFGISILFARLNQTGETDAAVEDMWRKCMEFDPKWTVHFRDQTLLWFISRPGKVGQKMSELVYRMARKIVRFN